MFTHSLRSQVASLIACLSLTPNLLLITVVYWIFPQRPVPFSWGLVLWLPLLVILSAGIGYWSSSLMLRPLTLLARELSHLESDLWRSHSQRWTLIQNPRDPQEALILRSAFDKLLRQVQIEQEHRDAFTATLMHDLKTPLIASNHLLTALKHQDLSRSEWELILDQLLQENDRILELVRKMVEVHRFEQEEVRLHRQTCDLGLLAQNLVRRLQPLAAQRGVTLQARGGTLLSVDGAELERALYNLVDNALRVARHQVQIEILSDRLRVRDDGPGLPAPLDQLARPYVAGPFEVAGQRYTARSSGLGLFIARRIMEAHGGGLQVNQTGPEGTTLDLVVGIPDRRAS